MDVGLGVLIRMATGTTVATAVSSQTGSKPTSDSLMSRPLPGVLGDELLGEPVGDAGGGVLGGSPGNNGY